jgi:predicted nucleic acid-binding protein
LILYLDTSALVKLYAVEEGRKAVEQAVEEADRVATCAVAYAEARAALARKLREGVFSEEEHREAVAALDEDWRTLEALSVTENVARLAGDLAERHALRGFDAVHLASALLVRAASREQGDGEDVLFLGFDVDLMGAAAEVMSVDEPGEVPRDGG